MIRSLFVKDAVEKKRGQGQYGEWVLWDITDDKGNHYSTFDNRVAESKGHAIQVSAEVQVKEVGGKEYKNTMLKLALCSGKCSLHCGEEPENFKNA